MTPRLERASIVAVGDELLAGAHPDLDSPEVARALAELGLTVEGVRVVPDDEETIAAAVSAVIAPGTLVVVSGGLGPTGDDVTRHGIARALGVELELSEEALAEIERWFRHRGIAMSDTNRRQALFPRGSVRIQNRAGTAPGFRVEVGGAIVVSLPGPPRELRQVLEEEVVPWLVEARLVPEPPAEHRLHLFGLSESVFEERCGAWMERGADPRMGCSAKRGVLTVSLRARERGPEAGARLRERVAAFRERFADHVFSETTPRPEQVLGEALIDRGISITTAESCTGGLVASRLTDVPGISAVFREGFVTYANEAKARALGVDEALLAEHGAVSPAVAEAMAGGAARAAGARLALSITGIAGPGGGTEEKPVGLVWFGTSLDGEVRTTSRRFPPRERRWIRALAATTALHLGWRRLREAGLAAPPFGESARGE